MGSGSGNGSGPGLTSESSPGSGSGSGLGAGLGSGSTGGSRRDSAANKLNMQAWMRLFRISAKRIATRFQIS